MWGRRCCPALEQPWGLFLKRLTSSPLVFTSTSTPVPTAWALRSFSSSCQFRIYFAQCAKLTATYLSAFLISKCCWRCLSFFFLIYALKQQQKCLCCFGVSGQSKVKYSIWEARFLLLRGLEELGGRLWIKAPSSRAFLLGRGELGPAAHGKPGGWGDSSGLCQVCCV